MSEIKNKSNILSVIDHIRSQKARPDVDRICKFMLKYHKVLPRDTKADLARCLQEKSVYKVDYKDNVSYRNAANSKKNRTENKTMDSSSAAASSERRVITTAIASLIYQDQTYLENGIAFEDLVKAAASQESKYTKKQLEAIIQKELSSGSLIKLPNKNLALGPADNDDNSSDSVKFEYNTDSNTKISSANSSNRSSPLRMRGRPRKRGGASGPSSTNSTHSTRAVRVGERRKMAKKVFDPSDLNLPSKRKRGRPAGSLNKATRKLNKYKEEDDSQQSDHSEEMDAEEVSELSDKERSGVCSVCMLNKPNDRLIECRDCSSKAHLSCLEAGSGILKLRPDNSWQCPHCKTCVVCCETNDAGVLTVCSVCSDAYHALCHSPRIPERLKAWDQWKCHNCLDRPAVAGSPVVIQCEPAMEEPFLKPHEIDRAESKLGDVKVDESIPDIKDWSSDDVYEYFVKDYPDAAEIMKEQDMDGQALSMARRADIVQGLGLPLGPALAVYCVIVKLQTRKDDWTVCWG